MLTNGNYRECKYIYITTRKETDKKLLHENLTKSYFHGVKFESQC